MKDKLISQFQGKTILGALLESLAEEMSEILQAFDDLANKRWIDTGEGKQLDGIGEIVGRDRLIANAIALPFFGFIDQPAALGFEVGKFRDTGESWQASTILSDYEYRPILWAKVFKNTTDGTTNEVIRSLCAVFKVDTIVVDDVGNAKINIGIGRKLERSEIVLMRAYSLLIRAGGVGMQWAINYDKDCYFGFLGQKNAKGFDEGKFADLITL